VPASSFAPAHGGNQVRQGNPNPQGPAAAGAVDSQNWAIDSELYETPNDGCVVDPGELVRIRYINRSKLVHRKLLHGHASRSCRPAVRWPARAGTRRSAADRGLDIETGNLGRWITHCHNTYHLESEWRTLLNMPF
jgi:multicopper oxidase